MKPDRLPYRIAAILFCGAALSSCRTIPAVEMLGDPAPLSAATRTINIGPDTKWVNVTGGETVKFTIGDKAFAWNFDGALDLDSFPLNQVVPPDLLDHPVQAYVAPNPSYLGGGGRHGGHGGHHK